MTDATRHPVGRAGGAHGRVRCDDTRCYTKTTNNLRLWESKPKRGFDLNSFNAGNYEGAVEASNSAAAITSVLYPNDHTSFGKELRLEEPCFWTAASLADILRRFKNIGKPITKFPDYVTIQLNDTHPTLAIPELMRILIEEDQPRESAWQIVTNTFYTNHTVLPEALEKWAVPLLEHLLLRHLQIIYDIKLLFLQSVEKKFPGDRDRLGCISLIEEGFPKQYKCQTLNILGVIHRSTEEHERGGEEGQPARRVLCGQGRPSVLLTIRLIVNVARVINADPDTKDLLQHISTAGTEASGTSNTKFCLNGGLLLGTVDGVNIEIAEEVGESNVLFFGHLTLHGRGGPPLPHTYQPIPIEEKCPALANVLNQISAGLFDDANVYEPLLNTIRQGDYYLLADDFDYCVIPSAVYTFDSAIC
ncbi:hypothetical protein B0H13DRAFT_2421798 [Mycena leptocephala]|nr:hypothetical protein B0H13DRAFT_2421798 [Mycena leptocephala]